MTGSEQSIQLSATAGDRQTVRKKPELLAPAKDPEVLRTAVRYGADAVYIGGEAYSLRAKARNFSREEMADSIDWAHENGACVYVTANIYAHESDLEGAEAYFRELREMRPDALLISDPGMFLLARQYCPEIPVHISTQANNTNHMTFRFWYDQGVRRVVCARELSLAEISRIRREIPEDCEIEAFVHGSMCISYSGRCLLSSYLAGRDANRGACAHPCRWQYALVEETRPGLYLPVEENDRGTYIMNGGDLCMLGHVPELMEAGIDCFKIEGRMKNALYVAQTVGAYRRAIDLCTGGDLEGYRRELPALEQQLRRCTWRKFTTGFYFGRPGREEMVYDSNSYTEGAVWMGIVEEPHVTDAGVTFKLKQRNKFSVGERLTALLQGGGEIDLEIAGIRDAEGTAMESAPHPGQLVEVTAGVPAGREGLLRRGDILRRDATGDLTV